LPICTAGCIAEHIGRCHREGFTSRRATDGNVRSGSPRWRTRSSSTRRSPSSIRYMRRTPEPSLVESRDGRLWFATTRSVASLTLNLLEALRNRVPPTVKALSVSAGGKMFRNMNSVHLPAHSDHIQIDYTATSLAVPERVLFRYKLDGVDNAWREAGTQREVSYTNLEPGEYRFHVTAANNDGLWSLKEAELRIFIQPAYYQTSWFRALCLSSVLIAAWFAVRFRIRSVTTQLRTRLLERVSERERIARELHDTLLQSLFGLMLQFQTAADRLPEGDSARPALDRALRQSELVMNEGRQRIKTLRTEQAEVATLTDAIQKISFELEPLGYARFQLAVEGPPRVIRVAVQEEVLLIAREALVNAYTHANATCIRVDVSYSRRGLCLSVLDDGRGIDPVYCENGREDHWGLSGMRERASKVRASITVRRREVGGTAVDLRVPAAVAFAYPRNGWKRFFGNKPRIEAWISNE
jgi:signal transduction histidine kinase